MRKLSEVFGLFAVTFIVGLGYFRYWVSPNSVDRDPAAIAKVFDFSHLRGEKLQEAVKQRLLAGFEIQKTEAGTGISLGHFVFMDNAGQKKLACEQFKKVALIFEGDGASVAGDLPTMQVEGVCDFSTDMAKINPLVIPVSKILGEKAGDGEFQFNEGLGISISFSNVPDEWPRTWILKSVRLVNPTNTEAVIIESDEVARYLGHPLVLSW